MLVQKKTANQIACLATLKNEVRQTFGKADLKSEDWLKISSLAFLRMVV
jgi:hypothetical protein